MKKETLYKYMQQVAPFLTNRRLCTTCMNERDAGDFVALKRKHTTVYRCNQCMNKQSDSWIRR